MESKSRSLNLKQSNGGRIWVNPVAGSEIPIPKRKLEIYLKSIPKDCFENDLLPHFERFGPVYQLRLLIDYDNNNRGFGYLIYFFEKSYLLCLDLMPFFFIKPGVMLDVEKSLERSHLTVWNIPPGLPDQLIHNQFNQLYENIVKIHVNRSETTNCSAVLEFADHQSALKAKQWTGIGSINLWNRNIRMLWTKEEEIEALMQEAGEVKQILFHNMPEDYDPEDLAKIICKHIPSRELVSIRRMRSDWLIRFTETNAARTIVKALYRQIIGKNQIDIEWLTSERMKKIKNVADFDFELRCMCIANYCDPPIFIYGRIIATSSTQFCSVIIKNNRKNQFHCFIFEMCYEGLVDIHSRVCEALVLILMELKEIPKRNLVVKCNKTHAFIVGLIRRLDQPALTPSVLASNHSIHMYLTEVFSLAKISHELIVSQDLESVHRENQLILKQKNFNYQFICGVASDGNFLGCIDPIYRRGKPLIHQLDQRNMMFAMVDGFSLSNNNTLVYPDIFNIKSLRFEQTIRVREEKFELIPLEICQRQDAHFTYRPYIEFNRVDTHGPLQQHLTSLMTFSNLRQLSVPAPFESPIPSQLPVPNFSSSSFQSFHK